MPDAVVPAGEPAESFVVAGKRPCGCLSMVTLDAPYRRLAVARFVSKMLRSDLALERVPLRDVTPGRWSCHTCKPARPARAPRAA